MKTYQVTWAINVRADTPQQAAEEVWYNIFDGGTPTPGDVCRFMVIEEGSPATHIIDLSKEG